MIVCSNGGLVEIQWVSACLQVVMLMRAPPGSEDDRLAKAALFTKFTGKGLVVGFMVFV